MGEGCSSNFGSPRPLPLGGGGLLKFGIIEAPTTWGRGPPPFWDHRGPRCMGVRASSVLGPPRPPPHGRGASPILGPPRPPPHGRGGLLIFGTTEAPAACSWGLVRLGTTVAPSARVWEPLLHGCGRVLRYGSTEAPVGLARGPPPFWNY